MFNSHQRNELSPTPMHSLPKKTQTCLLLANAFTCRNLKSSKIQFFAKYPQLKSHPLQSIITKNKYLNSNLILNPSNKAQPAKDPLKKNLITSISTQMHQKNIILSFYHKNNHNSVEKQNKIKYKRNQYSCLEKLRQVTQKYDNIKNQFINKIKINKKNCINKLNISNIIQCQKIINRQILNNKQNVQKQYEHNKFISKQYRKRCQSQNSKKPQRYIQLSVAQFMEQQQTNISTSISKKFDELKKTWLQNGKISQKKYFQESNSVDRDNLSYLNSPQIK